MSLVYYERVLCDFVQWRTNMFYNILAITLVAIFHRKTSAYIYCDRNDCTTVKDDLPHVTNDLSEGRLPQDIIPLHYNLELQPDIYTGGPPFYFNGAVEIKIEVKTATDTIYLNQVDFNFSDSITITVSDDSPIQPGDPEWTTYAVDDDLQLFALYVVEPLAVGAVYVLKIDYDSFLGNPGALGLYWDSYEDSDGTIRYLVASTFFARRVMPSFDEPIFKATYNVTVLRQQPMSTLSNMPLLYQEDRGNGWIADVFDETVKMSAYLLCIAVTDFEYVETVTSKGVPVRIWTRSEAIYATEFANSIAAPILEWYEEYTGIDYVLPKLDHIALPSQPGGMEHWGLITYDEDALLFDTDTSTSLSKHRIAEIVAHETAHMWFGNLVTCLYWNHTWLNEGFATYFHFQPLLDVLGWDGDEMETKEYMEVMNLDNSNTSYPVRYEAGNIQEAGISFNSFTYSKGSAMINLIEQIIGRNTLQRGLQRYLNRFAFDNAETDDLWEALNEQIQEDDIRDPDGNLIDIKEKMDPWINQRGHPIVTVDRTTSGVLGLSQEMFFNPEGQEANIPSPWDYLWNIPITFTSQSSPEVDTTTKAWMDRTESIEVTVPNEEEWILLNPDFTGFYRVLYSEQDQTSLVNQLLSGFKPALYNYGIYGKVPNDLFTSFCNSPASFVYGMYGKNISVHNRAQLINDAIQFARSNIQKESKAMEFTKYMGEEMSYVPWRALEISLPYQTLMLSKFNDTRQSQGDYMLSIVDPVYTAVGWENDGNHLTNLLRQIIIRLACSFNQESCIGQSQQLYQQYQNDVLNNPINSDQRATVYCTAIRTGLQTDWDFAYNTYQSIADEHVTRTNATKERQLLIPSMACTSDEAQMISYLDATYDSTIIRTRDAQSAVLSISRSDIGRPLVWERLSDNWRNEPVPQGVSKNAVFNEITDSFNTEEELFLLTSFIETYPPLDEGEENLYISAIKTVERNIQWITENKDDLHSWFEQSTPIIYKDSSTQAPFFNILYAVTHKNSCKQF